MANVDPQVAALLRGYKSAIQQLQQQVSALAPAVNAQQPTANTIWDEINHTPGRWIESVFSGEVVFTAANEGQRSQPIIIQISQDGPFVQTHYPMALWRPTQPNTATNLNRWRPVSTFPLPSQVVNTDIIDLMYEIQDGGSQRQFQNEPRGPIFSRPDNMVPLPSPVIWAPNAAIVFTPTYLAITWDAAVAPTEGTLHVDFPGFRIVNL